MNTEIYKALIGSRCHGLNDENSDYDYKGVFVTPTKRFFELGVAKPKDSYKIDEEHDKDSDSLEVGHFLHLATNSNPTILEVFKTPTYSAHRVFIQNESDLGYSHWAPGGELRALFPHVWSSKLVHAAFKGYSRSQLERMFGDKKEYVERKFKYATAYIRVLLSGIELLVTNDFHTEIQEKYIFPKTQIFVPSPHTLGALGRYDSWRCFLKAVRKEQITIGEIINVANTLREIIDKAYEFNPNKEVNLEPINEYLYRVRKEFWE